MKNKDFFYLQYDKINWENQEKTKINSFINNIIIEDFILKHKSSTIKIFDIGAGIGFFMKMLYPKLIKFYRDITLMGCEPSDKNYDYFMKKPLKVSKNVKLKIDKDTFQDIQTNEKFDFIISIYVFPHFSSGDLGKIVKKIYSMLDNDGKFILVVADEKYLKEKLKTKKDLFIENNIIEMGGEKYKEVLHYSDIPEIGKIIDYNREEKYYLDLFKKNKFKLIQKRNFNDKGFLCTLFVFQK